MELKEQAMTLVSFLFSIHMPLQRFELDTSAFFLRGFQQAKQSVRVVQRLAFEHRTLLLGQLTLVLFVHTTDS
jgi:hypothetical protein